MNKETISLIGRIFKETIISAIGGLLIAAIIVFTENPFNAFLPTIDYLITQIWTGVTAWSKIASINSPVQYALNATILVLIISALLNSINRERGSSLAFWILNAPGVAVWSRQMPRLVKTRAGVVIRGFGGAMRLYLWIGAFLLYLAYPIFSIANSQTSLFVATTSTLLASASFGAIFGRLEKGLYLAVKQTAENGIRGEYQWSKLPALCWATMIPACTVAGASLTYVTAISLGNRSLSELFSSLSSVFISTFLLVVILYYMIASGALALVHTSGLVRSYRNGEWTLRQKVREYDFSESKIEDEYGYPEYFADALLEIDDSEGSN